MYIIFVLVSFMACVIGRICGLGGGVIIKPVLDAFGLVSPQVINFLSSCTVLVMTAYSVSKAVVKKDVQMDLSISTPLAIGSCIGGIAGKKVFTALISLLPSADMSAMVQAAILLFMLIPVLIFTVFKSKVHTYSIKNKALCVIVGFVLGVISAFLSGGSGPMNMAVLLFLFSMPSKVAVINSLYIILFSQIASFVQTVASKNIPSFNILILIGMILGAILGSECGRFVNNKVSSKTVDKLFVLLLISLIVLNIFNIVKYV